MSFDVAVPPRSAKDFYLYGSAREGGFYVLSYRLRVLNESVSWGGSSFYVRDRSPNYAVARAMPSAVEGHVRLRAITT
jgi:hypothetical protein